MSGSGKAKLRPLKGSPSSPRNISPQVPGYKRQKSTFLRTKFIVGDQFAPVNTTAGRVVTSQYHSKKAGKNLTETMVVKRGRLKILSFFSHPDTQFFTAATSVIAVSDQDLDRMLGLSDEGSSEILAIMQDMNSKKLKYYSFDHLFQEVATVIRSGESPFRLDCRDSTGGAKAETNGTTSCNRRGIGGKGRLNDHREVLRTRDLGRGERFQPPCG